MMVSPYTRHGGTARFIIFLAELATCFVDLSKKNPFPSFRVLHVSTFELDQNQLIHQITLTNAKPKPLIFCVCIHAYLYFEYFVIVISDHGRFHVCTK